MTPSTNIRVSVQNMSCASCVGRVERALAAVPGVDAVNVNLASETAQAQIDSDIRVPAVIDALERAGARVPDRRRTAVAISLSH